MLYWSGMTKEIKIFLGIIIGLMVIIGGFVVMSAKVPGKYDDFAQCITDSGTKFFGAFWCPHCAAQKQLFGKSVKKLPYVECSNPDQSQTQICIDNKIESYPTWVYPKGVTVTSDTQPIVCSPQPGKAGENEICKKEVSQYFTTWLFKDITVKSMGQPTIKDKTWVFPVGSQVVAEQSFDALAAQTGCVAPTQ